jgi:hypothetical protein
MKLPQTHYPSFLAFISFAIAMLFLFTLGMVLGLSALFDYAREGTVNAQSAVHAVALFFIGGMFGIASAVSLLRFLNKPAAEFRRLSMQFALVNMDSEEALALILPYLIKPGMVIPALIFFSILIPLLEELVKPLAVWLLAGKLDSAAQGFAFGAGSRHGPKRRGIPAMDIHCCVDRPCRRVVDPPHRLQSQVAEGNARTREEISVPPSNEISQPKASW